RPRQNFSSHFQYDIKQTTNENKERYQFGEYWLIQFQILQTNITEIVWQTIRRITNEILGVKGQNFSLQYQYNIKQTSYENKEKYQLGDYKIIQYQILQTNIQRTVWEI
ncbi:hypothetical protein pdam_00008766, partial [Pocillopora damicornis]